MGLLSREASGMDVVIGHVVGPVPKAGPKAVRYSADTQFSSFAFMRAGGTVQVAAASSTSSTSSHRAPRTSPERQAVSTRNSNASAVARDDAAPGCQHLPAWVPGQHWDRVVTMDDATNEHYSMFFCEEEGTASSFQGVREVIESRGLFCSLYTDRASHYWHTPKEGGKGQTRGT